MYFLKSPADPNYQIFRAKKDQISKILSEEIYKQFDANIKISKVMENSLNQKTGLIDDAYFYKNVVPLIGQKDAETALARMKVIYYENVGGKVFDGVLPLLNAHARIPVCGLVSQYNATELPDGKDRLGVLMGNILSKRLTIKGFIIFEEYGDHFPEFLATMSKWLESGDVKTKEHQVDGLAQAPQAFFDMLDGKNFGKTVVKVADVK